MEVKEMKIERFKTFEEYVKIASADDRIVAFAVEQHGNMAVFYSYIEGEAVEYGTSWLLYVRQNMNNKNWEQGDSVLLGKGMNRLKNLFCWLKRILKIHLGANLWYNFM